MLAVGRSPAWLEIAGELIRLRVREASVDRVFDSIGERTTVLFAESVSTELLEALVEIGPAVVAIIDGSTGTLPRLANATIVRQISGRATVRLHRGSSPRAHVVARYLKVLAGSH